MLYDSYWFISITNNVVQSAPLHNRAKKGGDICRELFIDTDCNDAVCVFLF